MSKLIGYFKNQFTDSASGRVVDYAKLFVADDITKGGAGQNVACYKATVNAIAPLTPKDIGRDCVVYFDQYKRAQMVSFETAKF